MIEATPRRKLARSSEVIKKWGAIFPWATRYYCFACGNTGGVEKAHLHAHCFGGSGKADNLVLLCEYCHFQFDVRFSGYSEDREDQIKWILEYHQINMKCFMDYVRKITTPLTIAERIKIHLSFMLLYSQENIPENFKKHLKNLNSQRTAQFISRNLSYADRRIIEINIIMKELAHISLTDFPREEVNLFRRLFITQEKQHVPMS
jgi:hypothetical protein